MIDFQILQAVCSPVFVGLRSAIELKKEKRELLNESKRDPDVDMALDLIKPAWWDWATRKGRKK